jgi:tellurite methyltransferase
LEHLFDGVTGISYDVGVGSSSKWFLLLLIFANPGLASGADPESSKTFEAITGESADEDHSAWDSFYKKKDHAFGRDAVGFLKEHLGRLRKGEAFVPAMGEGRNALFLARNGFQVLGVDLSPVAVDRAIAEARGLRLPLRGVVADLNQYPYPEEKFDFILLSLFYSPSLLPKLKKSLKKGAHLMIYLKVETGRGKDRSTPDDFTVKPGELKSALSDFEVLTYREYRDQSVDVVGVLARKP